VDGRELQRKAETAELLLDAARQLGETLEPERVYDRFHELLSGSVQHDAVVVSSYEESDGMIRCDYAWVEGNRLDPAVFPPVALNRAGGGMQSRAIVGGEPLLFNDVPERVQGEGTYYDVDARGTVRKLPESGPPGTQAVMMVPVKHEGRVVGVVQLMSDSRAFAPHELELFEGLVGQMAAAVRNARLQRQRVRLEAAEAAARAVAAEREQAAHVLDVVGDGIFLVDADGIVRLGNHAAETATRLAARDVLGRPLDEIYAGWRLLAARVPVAEGGTQPRSVTLPVDIRGRDLWLSFVAVRGPDGVVYAFRDLTNERRLDEEKSDFIATVSHELRTPMAAVYGAAETLLRRERELAPERARQLLEMIATQAARLTQITEEVLLASRLDRGDVALERARVDLAELAHAAVGAVAASVAVIAPEPVSAYGDADRIQQVLVNLLDNAVKYGGGDVTLRVEARNGTAVLAVSDTGPGIPRAEQQRIFEKFYRADPHLTHAPGGTGLGLYISRELVERMGGRLDVASELGSGTTFLVELPAA
jgi:two-component system, OmpR family, phosphate regulon sensor histidine kinase PhoR